MTSISTEDKRIVEIMRYSKSVAVLLLAACILILLFTSFYITSFSVSDSNPTTYVIVPTLMLPLFAILCVKEKVKIRVTRRSAVIGSLLFASFLVMTILLRVYFSFMFLSFRIDLLLFPLAIAALIALLFGHTNVSKFKWLMAYPVIASPIVLLPILTLYNAFTTFNTLIVYNVIKAFMPGVAFFAPITIYANGYSIGIGQACVSIGIFLSLFLFLVPLAYFYSGTHKAKALWIASGIVMLLLLNIVRMLSISYVWLSGGPNNTALNVHAFIGTLLFYVIVLVMVLIAKHYGLEIPPAEKRGSKRASRIEFNAFSIFAAVFFSLIYLYLTLNYSTASMASPISFTNLAQFSFSNSATSNYIYALLVSHNFSGTVLYTQGSYALISLTNKTTGTLNPLLFEVTSDQGVVKNIGKNNLVKNSLVFLDRKGFTVQVLDVVSNGTEYFIYASSLPIPLPNSSVSLAGIYLIIPASDLHNAPCSYDYYYSTFANIFWPPSFGADTKKTASAFCIGEAVVR